MTTILLLLWLYFTEGQPARCWVVVQTSPQIQTWGIFADPDDALLYARTFVRGRYLISPYRSPTCP